MNTLRPTTHRTASLLLLLLPTAVVAVDINILFLAMPALTAELGVSPLQQLWITDIYGLMVGVLAIVAGAVGDRIGRRRLLFLGCAGFLVASVLAAFAPSAEVLLLARVLQGVAGATLMPSTLALIGEIFPTESERQKAIGLWATCQFGFASLGPVVGGLLLQWFWWGSVFLLAVPVCLIVLCLGPRLLPDSRPADRAPKVDLLSAGVLIAVLIALFTAIKAVVPGAGVATPVALGAGVLAMAGGAYFIGRQSRLAAPFLDLALLRSPMIGVSVASLTIVAIVLAGSGCWVTQYLQSAVGLTPLIAAVTFMPMGVGIGLGTFLTPILMRRFSPEGLIVGGLVLAAVGALGQVVVPASHPLPMLVVAITVTACGCGPLFAIGTGRIVSAAPASAAGRAAALAETSNHLGSSLGLALVGTVASTAYLVAARPALAGITDDAAAGSMATTRDAAAGSPHAGAILEALTAAGTDSLHVLGFCTAALLFGCAIQQGVTGRSRTDHSVPTGTAS